MNTDALKIKAADLALDVCKQFITLAVAAIGFVVSYLYNSNVHIPIPLIILSVLAYMVSIISGVLILLHTIYEWGKDRPVDVHGDNIRSQALLQIVFAIVGLILTTFILFYRPIAAVAK